jgi:DNA-directed RNA polymerase III subunit RPC2
MGKQAMGSIAFNQFKRMDTLLYLLVYPQRPMVKSRTIELVGYEQLPAGQNATVAVMSYSGYDIEDALVLNKASLDRGFGRCLVYKKSSAVLRKYANGTFDRLADPPLDEEGTVLERFDIIEPDGIAGVGECVHQGQVYINKQMPTGTTETINTQAAANYKPAPMSHKTPYPAFIDKVKAE